MDDKTLLERAAKAAGIFLTPQTLAEALPKWGWDEHFAIRHIDDGGMSGTVLVYNYEGELSGTTREEWHPLTDDGDEARLEGALCFNVTWGMASVTVDMSTERYNDHNGDKQKARRYAGVRAAAAIGSAHEPTL
jgi:hypothetical protein